MFPRIARSLPWLRRPGPTQMGESILRAGSPTVLSCTYSPVHRACSRQKRARASGSLIAGKGGRRGDWERHSRRLVTTALRALSSGLQLDPHARQPPTVWSTRTDAAQVRPFTGTPSFPPSLVALAAVLSLVAQSCLLSPRTVQYSTGQQAGRRTYCTGCLGHGDARPEKCDTRHPHLYFPPACHPKRPPRCDRSLARTGADPTVHVLSFSRQAPALSSLSLNIPSPYTFDMAYKFVGSDNFKYELWMVFG
jgi:hypothetical protein